MVGVHRAAAPAARVARQVEVARELEPGELGHLGRVRLTGQGSGLRVRVRVGVGVWVRVRDGVGLAVSEGGHRGEGRVKSAHRGGHHDQVHP